MPDQQVPSKVLLDIPVVLAVVVVEMAILDHKAMLDLPDQQALYKDLLDIPAVLAVAVVGGMVIQDQLDILGRLAILDQLELLGILVQV
jgi:hypothetical protein